MHLRSKHNTIYSRLAYVKNQAKKVTGPVFMGFMGCL